MSVSYFYMNYLPPMTPADWSSETGVMLTEALNSPWNQVPVPHLFLPSWVPDRLLTELMTQMPPMERLTKIEGGGLILRSEKFQGLAWNMYDAMMRYLLSLLLTRCAPWWPSVQERVGNELGSAWDTAFYPSFISIADPSRGVGPHIDGDTSVLTAITVLGYEDMSPAPVTNFFIEGPDSFRPSTSYSPSRGSLFIMPNLGPESTHGVIESIGPGRITHIASIMAVARDAQ
jgi:hypothetical protein